MDDKRIASILVDLDLGEGIHGNTEINWQYENYIQPLDYWKITFWCSICCDIGHLQKDRPYPKPVHRKFWNKKSRAVNNSIVFDQMEPHEDVNIEDNPGLDAQWNGSLQKLLGFSLGH